MATGKKLTMKVAVTANLRNGILWQAVRDAGSQARLAEYLGVSQNVICAWLNFRKCPDFLNPVRSERYREIERKLFDLTGHTFDEIFPPEIRNKQFLARQKKIDAIVELPVEQLVAAGAAPQLQPAPDELLFAEDRKTVIDHVISELKPRESEVIRMRFGLEPYEREHILDEVAEKIGVTRERARQIEVKALRKMRHPAKAKQLQVVKCF